jgi:hypothetical protein
VAARPAPPEPDQPASARPLADRLRVAAGRLRSPALWWRHRWDLVLVGVVLVGCALRVRQWWAPVSFLNDEIALLYSLRSYPLDELLSRPLILEQGAPALWLLIERGVLGAFGHTEHAMRAMPMVSTCLGLGLLALLARKVLSGPAAVAATALFAIAPLTLFYALQVKPYGSDMAATAALVLVAVWLARTPVWSWRHGVLWWGAASLGAGFSFSSFLLTGSLAGALVLGRLAGARSTAEAPDRTPRERFAECVRFAVPVVIWVGTVGLVYLLQLRYLNGKQSRYPYWMSGFGPVDGDVWEWANWLWKVSADLFALTFYTPVTWAGIVLAILGAVSLWRRDRAVALLLLTPVAVAYVAAAAHAYPLKQRLALWLVPILVLLVAEPVLAARRRADHRGRWFERAPGGVLASLLVLAILVPAYQYTRDMVRSPGSVTLADPGAADRIDLVLPTVRAGWRDGDRLLTVDSTIHRSNWYGHTMDLRPHGYFMFRRGDDCGDAARASTAGARRAWFVSGSPWSSGEPSLEDTVVGRLRTRGKVTLVRTEGRVTLYLADLTATPDLRADDPAANLNRPGGCLLYDEGAIALR